MTTYTEQWCEQHCCDTVIEIRTALFDLDGDVDHELDYPDQYPHGTVDQIPTISHEVMYTNPETNLAQVVWTPRDGWGYYLTGEYARGYALRPMDLAVDATSAAVAAAVRHLCLQHLH